MDFSLLVDVLDSRVEQAIMAAVLAVLLLGRSWPRSLPRCLPFNTIAGIARVEAIRKTTEADERTHRRTRGD
jgi:hypothetical protein